jgi:sugar/nucleoside kinase (ribokinase family)
VGDALDEAVAALTGSGKLVLVKRGEAGALAADRNGRLAGPALAVEPVETTGAGDCFNAGFMMALLEGASVAACLAAGNAAGALSTQAPSSSGIPTRSALDAARAQLSPLPPPRARVNA